MSGMIFRENPEKIFKLLISFNNVSLIFMYKMYKMYKMKERNTLCASPISFLVARVEIFFYDFYFFHLFSYFLIDVDGDNV